MDKLSQEYEMNRIESALESEAFIFCIDLDNNIGVHAALSAKVSAVIYQVSTIIWLTIYRPTSEQSCLQQTEM